MRDTVSSTICPEQLEHLVQLKPEAASGSVAISKYGAAAVTSTQNGMKFFVDLETIRSFDLGQFQAILRNATAFKPRCGYFCWFKCIISSG
jgi:hypothetical protein